MAPALGAEISGIDLAGNVDEGAIRGIRDALNRYAVVVLREQHLSPDDQINFSRRLGPLRVSFLNQYAAEGFRELTVVSNIIENGRQIGVPDAGVLWHTDGSYLKTPDMYHFCMRPGTRAGQPLGDTYWLSTAEAHDALPGSRRGSQPQGIHSYTRHIMKKRSTENTSRTAQKRIETNSPTWNTR